jgi:hypothetical protein
MADAPWRFIPFMSVGGKQDLTEAAYPIEERLLDLLVDAHQSTDSDLDLLENCTANIEKALSRDDPNEENHDQWERLLLLVQRAQMAMKTGSPAEIAKAFYLLGQKSEFLRRWTSDIEKEIAKETYKKAFKLIEASTRALYEKKKQKNIASKKRWTPEYECAKAFVQTVAIGFIERDIENELRMGSLSELVSTYCDDNCAAIKNWRIDGLEVDVYQHIPDPEKTRTYREWIKPVIKPEYAYIQKGGHPTKS